MKKTLVMIMAAVLALAAVAAYAERDNDRITMQGTVRSLSHERNGYRVQLDRGGYSFWVPESAVRGRGGNFRVGVSIRFGGVFRGGIIYVDIVDWPEMDRYGNRYYSASVRGVVERVDLRRGTLLLRDEVNRRRVIIDMTRIGRRRGAGLEDLRRGDYVELSGDWVRGTFVAYRIDMVRGGRY